MGWALPQAATDGASLFLQRQAARLAEQDWEVEIFTIARAEKLGDRAVCDWQVIRQNYCSIPYSVLVRPWGLLHTDPENPLRSMAEPRTTEVFTDVLRSRSWDWVHFNEANPLELIEIAKQTGCEVSFTFHNFYALYPHEHLFSNGVFERQPCADLTIYTPTAERAIEEYQSFGTLPPTLEPAVSNRLNSEFKTRMDYGRYLLEEVVDRISGSHARFLEASRELFSLNLSRVSEDHPPDYDFDVHAAANQCADRDPSGPLVIAELANIQRFKGQHILVFLADELREHSGKFELRLYGNVNDTPYMRYLEQLVGEDPFRQQHVRFCGGYRQAELPDIAREIHVHVSTIPLYPYISGSQLETAPLGVLPILKQDVLFERCNDDHPDGLLSYRRGDVKGLARLIRGLLDGGVDPVQSFRLNAEALLRMEQHQVAPGGAQ